MLTRCIWINTAILSRSRSRRLLTTALNSNRLFSINTTTTAAKSIPSYKKSPTPTLISTASVIPPEWSLCIGIEVHAQIVSNSKLYSGSSVEFGAAANTHCSLIDAAFPGTLPSINTHCIDQTILTGLALNGSINSPSYFDRKHYYYCDLPQGYQITQLNKPLINGGYIELSNNHHNKRINISHIQLEQDSGKSIHDYSPYHSYIDLNRAGTALMEIVSQPDLTTAEEAVEYIRILSTILQYCNTCRAHMEDGSLRADINVSISRSNSNNPANRGERVEIKNLNSLRSLHRAILFEAKRQIGLLESGAKVNRETRGFDSKSGNTVLLRSKENLLDYRFMPEPDLPQLIINKDRINQLKSKLPELPAQLNSRLQSQYELTAYESNILIGEPGAAKFFELLIHGNQNNINQNIRIRSPRSSINWLTSELFGRIKKGITVTAADSNEDNSNINNSSIIGAAGIRTLTILDSPVNPIQLGSIIDLVESGSISGKTGKLVLDLLMNGDNRTASQIVNDNNWLISITDNSAVEELCNSILLQSNTELHQYLTKPNSRFLGYLVGQVLKSSQGKANPVIVKEIMTKLLNTAVEAHKQKK